MSTPTVYNHTIKGDALGIFARALFRLYQNDLIHQNGCFDLVMGSGKLFFAIKCNDRDSKRLLQWHREDYTAYYEGPHVMSSMQMTKVPTYPVIIPVLKLDEALHIKEKVYGCVVAFRDMEDLVGFWRGEHRVSLYITQTGEDYSLEFWKSPASEDLLERDEEIGVKALVTYPKL